MQHNHLAVIERQWAHWSRQQRFGGAHADEDQANRELLNRPPDTRRRAGPRPTPAKGQCSPRDKYLARTVTATNKNLGAIEFVKPVVVRVHANSPASVADESTTTGSQ